MDNVSKFGERLSELIFDAKINNRTLSSTIGVDVTTIRRWKHGTLDISLSHLLKLADYFHCSIDFLTGRSETQSEGIPKQCPPFYDRLREIMEKNNITRYRLVKETTIYDSYFTNWKRGVDIQLSTLIILANYFDCTIDYLIGR